jgi:SMC interacting uncharacterized protein involved in chromosome segregation
MSITVIVVCISVLLLTSIICVSCVMYYSSENKRALVSSQERYTNLSSLVDQKDREYLKLMNNKDEECKRLADVIKSLSEKQQNYNVNATVK